VYGVSAQVGNKSIVMKDYQGDKLVLHDLKVLWGGYDPGTTGYVPKLQTFDKYHKSTIPYDNGFLLKIQMDDVEVYHEYTGEDDIYEIKCDYEYRLAITHKKQVVASDTLKYQKVLGTFTSSLSAKDVHIIATNKASDLAIHLNETILTGSVAAFRNFSRKYVDLTYTKEYIKFYGISKTKKLMTGEQVKVLDQKLKKLKDTDKEIFNRDMFHTHVEELISDFKKLKNSEDYQVHDPYKFYVNANLASLHALLESYALVASYYETALQYNNKARFVSIVADELYKSQYRMTNKAIMFAEDGTFNADLSPKYLTFIETRKRANN
jgi:ASC-1-like (ASCH) protein